jgi:hypothetical protein
MSRWPVLAAFSIAPLLLGCGSARAGLSNAPRLGGTALADEQVHDVVSNGDDACGAIAEHGVLRNRIPPCPHAIHPLAGTSWLPSSAAQSPSDGGLVVPWLQHFYVGWPCPPPTPRRETRAVAWDVPRTSAGLCGAAGGGPRAPGP